MREILYRAKVKDKNELIGKGFPIDENGNLKSEWVFGVPIPRYPEIFLAWNEACNEYEEVTIISETVGQYTGLTDKNSTKIFEGDIVKTKYGRLCQVFWFSSPCSQGWDLMPIGDKHKCPDEYDLWIPKNLEVIGNVHDNPELLQN